MNKEHHARHSSCRYDRNELVLGLFIDSILADIPITPSFHDGVKVQAVIDAAFESDRTGCRVEVA